MSLLEMRHSSIAPNPVESREAPHNCTVSLTSQRHPLATPWTAAYQAPPPMRFSRQEYWSGVPLSIKSVMPSSHLILCRPLLLLPSIFPNIRVFSSESALPIRWPKYWTVRPHRRQPTRLPRPWDSPGKNTLMLGKIEGRRRRGWQRKR